VTLKAAVKSAAILNAIFHIPVSGCAWRMLSGDFLPYQTVYHYFHNGGLTECGSGSMTDSAE